MNRAPRGDLDLIRVVLAGPLGEVFNTIEKDGTLGMVVEYWFKDSVWLSRLR